VVSDLREFDARRAPSVAVGERGAQDRHRAPHYQRGHETSNYQPGQRTPRHSQGSAGYVVPTITWLNGGFGAGKTTLAEELSGIQAGAFEDVAYGAGRHPHAGSGEFTADPRIDRDVCACRSTCG
jgi:hypothetical protein